MARFDRLTVLNTVLKDGMVPLFYHENLAISQQIATALSQGGSTVLEFTNRGDMALDVFRGLNDYARQHLRDLVLGVGSVDDAPTAAIFIAYGANFIVSPAFNEAVARLCNRHKIAYMPGCQTVTEIATAEEFGAEIVKLFPGEVGGPSFVRAVLGPRPWTRIMPTGGVSPDEQNLRGWFEAGVACVGLGSKLIRSDWIKAGNYDALRETTSMALQQIRTIRSR